MRNSQEKHMYINFQYAQLHNASVFPNLSKDTIFLNTIKH